ncbi:hypothetical protein IAU60_002612 [Kwoniella sp. DSM 27419]
MSWKGAGQLISGPPSTTASTFGISSGPVGQRLRPSAQTTPHQRLIDQSRTYGVDKDAIAAEERKRRSEWDVVKDNHRFVREDEDDGVDTWEERVAKSYESKLFKEFALIDLKHYKSKRFALRWRTAPEVISGVGESTCASLRCKYHQPASAQPVNPSNLRFRDPEASTRASSSRFEDDMRGEEVMPELRSFELPFVYMEAGERKETLVKVRLCPRCVGKLRWKPDAKEDRPDKDKRNHGSRSRDDGLKGSKREHHESGRGSSSRQDRTREPERKRYSASRSRSRSPSRRRE